MLASMQSKGDVAYQLESARETRRAVKDNVKRLSGSFSARPSSDGSGRRLSIASDGGCRSPTMAELMQPQGPCAEEHPHNESADKWWEVVREKRHPAEPHSSFEKFDIKKRHHMTDIHSARGKTPASDGFEPPMLAQDAIFDPKACAFQGDYPHGLTNEAWAPARGDETPPSRYHSCSMLALDKRRHATPIDGGHKRSPQKRAADAHMGNPATETSGREVRPNFTGKKQQYKSAFMLQQHKKKHLAQMRSAGLRGDTANAGSTPAASTPERRTPDGRGTGAPTPTIPQSAGGSGFASHREMTYCKRFNTVQLKPTQQLHDEPGGALAERPWPRAGAKLGFESGSYSSGSTAPSYPVGDPPGTPLISSRVHDERALTKYSTKSGLRGSLDSSASEPGLLHSSQQELAQRKALCQTTIRHANSSGSPSGTPKPRDERRRGSGAASCSDIALRRDSGPGETLKSHRQLEMSKTIHKFAHDDSRRPRPQPTPCPVPPTPRSGQWTPAHI